MAAEDPKPTGWKNGDRVVLTTRGTVSFQRNGFVRVRWDDGGTTEVWGAALVAEKKPHVSAARDQEWPSP